MLRKSSVSTWIASSLDWLTWDWPYFKELANWQQQQQLQQQWVACFLKAHRVFSLERETTKKAKKGKEKVANKQLVANQ